MALRRDFWALVLENRATLELTRGARVFLNLQAGIGHREARDPEPAAAVGAGLSQQLDRLQQRLARTDQENALLRRRLALADVDAGGLAAGNLVWIFGAARTGSTWLASMMGSLKDYGTWDEPMVGDLFGHLYYVRGTRHVERRGDMFILGNPHRRSWLGSIRTFVLNEATAHFPELAVRGGYLIVKEPNGSVGAPLLMEALPESRMILLVRDPRDMVASLLDAHRQGGWLYQWQKDGGRGQGGVPDNDPDTFVRTLSKDYMRSMSGAKRAFEAHEGLKILVTYEDLRTDTLATMRRLYAALQLPFDAGQLVRTIEDSAWENIPDGEKGKGKFKRKATPGGWREELTTKQARIVEKITSPMLEEFYPGC